MPVGALFFLGDTMKREDASPDYKGLALEAMDILSETRTNKQHRLRLREIIRDICSQFGETECELRHLEMAGLNGKDKIKLARLQGLHSQVANIQVCSECKEHFDTMLEEMKYI